MPFPFSVATRVEAEFNLCMCVDKRPFTKV